MYAIKPLGYQEITVSTSAVGLNVPISPVKFATIRIAGAGIRWRDDGTNPTATIGDPLNVNDVLNLVTRLFNYREVLRAIRFIRSGASDATLHVHYYG